MEIAEKQKNDILEAVHIDFAARGAWLALFGESLTYALSGSLLGAAEQGQSFRIKNRPAVPYRETNVKKPCSRKDGALSDGSCSQRPARCGGAECVSRLRREVCKPRAGSRAPFYSLWVFRSPHSRTPQGGCRTDRSRTGPADSAGPPGSVDAVPSSVNPRRRKYPRTRRRKYRRCGRTHRRRRWSRGCPRRSRPRNI